MGTGFDPDKIVGKHNKPSSEQFREERLDRPGLTTTQWPAQIDRAALDLLHGIAFGQTASKTDIGGTIDRFEFPYATGEFYVDGLRELSGERSNLARTLKRYDAKAVGKLAFQLNEFRDQLRNLGTEEMDVDRAVEALVEKAATQALEESVRIDGKEGAGLRQLRDSDSAADLILKLFSDPRVEAYADTLIDIVGETTSEGLLAHLDEPRMTTPLWQHQQEALTKWFEHEQRGYVDMATATGKTVLGLGAIAARYGALHPVDAGILPDGIEGESDPRILVVAGNTLLLDQWRAELDAHLDIPPARTIPTETDRGTMIELGWGTIEFRTAQSLLQSASIPPYDLVILDEAHQYSRSRRDTRGWGDVFTDLVNRCGAVLAMSGSIDGGWQGDAAAKDALDEHLPRAYQFSIPQARARGVIADFSWEVRYAPTTDEGEVKLAEQTRHITDAYESLTGELDADTLEIETAALDGPYETYASLRSFAQSNAGSELREKSDAFDLFATAVFTRRPVRWNLSPTDETILDLVASHAPDEKTVVLVQNYDDASRLKERLAGDYELPPEVVIALESSNDDRQEKIEAFNDAPGGVIIGPGDLLGVGVDMPDAAVAVNIARGGVNASLVQRIGRVLRNPKGEKEARFYHVVPQPTSAEAIDRYEDGRQLLRQAVEFHALGKTFKEVPSFSIATDTVGRTVATLEQAGDAGFAQHGDDHVTDLVETNTAVDALTDLRSAIQTAMTSDEQSDTPILTTYWGCAESEADTTETTDKPTTDEEKADGPFAERNDVYEMYRLHLDQYRAAKGAAKYLLDGEFDVLQRDGEYLVHAPPAYQDTPFHEHYQRAFNRYIEAKRRADDEEGTLPLYREVWSSPPNEAGAMVQEEVATELGTDYSQDDPLFFPIEDGELYELPLPDGRIIAVDGIHEPEPSPGSTVTTGPPGIRIPRSVALAAKAHLDTDSDEEVATQIDSWVRAFIAQVLQDDIPAFVSELEISTPTTAVDLNSDTRSFVQAACTNPDGPFTDQSVVVEAAVRVALDLEPGATESVNVSVPTELLKAIDACDQIDLASVLGDALVDALATQQSTGH